MKYQYQPTCQIPLEALDEIYLRAFGYRDNGFFVEVGAHDGWHWSNTWGLAEIGWSGIYIEPLKELYDQCVETNKNRKNVKVEQCCISDANGTCQLGIDAYGASALSDKDVFEAKSYTLDTFLEQHLVPKEFDLLVVDVEGFEDKLLSGFTPSIWLPKLVIIERPPEPNVITSSGYRKIYQDWINTIYAR